MLNIDAIFDPQVIEAELAARRKQSAPDTEVRQPATPSIEADDLPPDWHFLWDERAAIMEYDGGLPRERAEAEALAAILRLMRAAEAANEAVKEKAE